MVIHRADDVVLYELLSTGAAGAPIINFLTNVQNIHVNINDGTSGKGYSDNDGAFDLHLKILQW